jgi:hypothetical protein
VKVCINAISKFPPAAYCSHGFFCTFTGYQLDYVFDWTISRQGADSNRLQVCTLFFVLKILIVQCLKGSSSAAVKLLPCGHEVMNSWKQPLAEMQGKAMYIRPKVAGPLLRPCASESYVYRAACFILIVHCFTFLNMYIFTAS